MKSKNRQPFAPDVRNLGGRQSVIENMLVHQAKLRAIKATLPPAKSRSTRRPGTPRKHTFVLDTTPPASFGLAEVISMNRRASEGLTGSSDQVLAKGTAGYLMMEHERRKLHMLRRIKEYTTPTERQKNKHDPVAHPVVLLRRTAPLPRPSPSPTVRGDSPIERARSLAPSGSAAELRLLSRALEQEIAAQARPRKQFFVPAAASGDELRPLMSQSPLLARSSRSPGRIVDPMTMARSRSSGALGRTRPAPHRLASPHRRHLTASQSMATFGRQRELEEKLSSSDKAGESNPYAKLKNKLFSLIVEHRIYREEHLLKLFDKARHINSHLDARRVDDVIRELMDELDVRPHAPADRPGPKMPPLRLAQIPPDALDEGVPMPVATADLHVSGGRRLKRDASKPAHRRKADAGATPTGPTASSSDASASSPTAVSTHAVETEASQDKNDIETGQEYSATGTASPPSRASPAPAVSGAAESPETASPPADGPSPPLAASEADAAPSVVSESSPRAPIPPVAPDSENDPTLESGASNVSSSVHASGAELTQEASSSSPSLHPDSDLVSNSAGVGSSSSSSSSSSSANVDSSSLLSSSASPPTPSQATEKRPDSYDADFD